MKTFGQAVDLAIEKHQKSYPESKVYKILSVETSDDIFIVELNATHFSGPLYYGVKKD